MKLIHWIKYLFERDEFDNFWFFGSSGIGTHWINSPVAQLSHLERVALHHMPANHSLKALTVSTYIMKFVSTNSYCLKQIKTTILMRRIKYTQVKDNQSWLQNNSPTITIYRFLARYLPMMSSDNFENSNGLNKKKVCWLKFHLCIAENE